MKTVRVLAALATLLTMGCVAPHQTETSTGYILPALGGCGVIGAWKIETVAANKIRFDMPISRNESATRFEVDCSDLTYTQVGIVEYGRDGHSSRTIPVNNPLSDPSVLPVLRQVCAISRSESTRTWGEFHSIPEFRTQVAHMDPAYFDGQPPCQRLRLVGPGTTSPNH